MAESQDTLRTLDGPALARLAWEWGFAPPSGARHSDGTYWAEEGTQRQWAAWRPWAVLAQAEAVFLQLRARGYSTSCCYFADDRQYGEVWAAKAGRQAWSVQWRAAGEEALALIRCAVLAVAGEQEKGES